MAERKRIGFFYESYSTYPALVIYVQNLVRTLLLTPEVTKPQLVILHLPDSPVDEIKKIGYPFIEFYELKNVYRSLGKRIINKGSRYLTKKNLSPFIDKDFPKNLDTVFPYNFRQECQYVQNKILWKPDFQEFHLPTYFTSKELSEHHAYVDNISKQPVRLVLSSQDSKRDYERYFPNHVNQIEIWPFTSFLPDYKHIDHKSLLNRYSVTKPYFVVANQFWPHKNHINVLKALVHSRQTQNDFQVVFTGKQTSYRDKDLFAKLNQFIVLNQLQEHVIFTGFIDREEQLSLMKNSIAVIQPSTFEGWSTVIEDCKALNQFVIASNISVNREQIKNNVFFFDPYNYKELSAILLEMLSTAPQKTDSDYVAEIGAFNKTLQTSFNLNG